MRSVRAVPAVPSLCPFVHPSPRLTNTGAEFHRCPLFKHLHYGVLLLLLCQTKPPWRWNNPTGQQPPPGSRGAAGPHQNSPPDSSKLDLIAGQETNLRVCWQQLSKFNVHIHLLTQQTDCFFVFFFPNLVAESDLPKTLDIT